MAMVIGIDPAASKPNAMAMIHNGKCIYYGNVDPDIKVIIGYFTRHSPDMVAIEGQYFGKNVKTLIQLAESRGRLVAACEYCGIPHKIIQPAQWLASIKIDPNMKAGPARDVWVKNVARALIKCPIEDDFNVDHAAAVHIGFYAFNRWHFKTAIMRDKL